MKPETEQALANLTRGEKRRVILLKISRLVSAAVAINFVVFAVMWFVLVGSRETGRGLYTIVSKGRPVSVSLEVAEYINFHERVVLYSILIAVPAIIYLALQRSDSSGG